MKEQLQKLLQSWREEARSLSNCNGCQSHGKLLKGKILELERIVCAPQDENLPDNFTFVVPSYPTVYTANFENDRYLVSWMDNDGFKHCVGYSMNSAKRYIKSGEWVRILACEQV